MWQKRNEAGYSINNENPQASGSVDTVAKNKLRLLINIRVCNKVQKPASHKAERFFYCLIKITARQ